MAAVRRKKQHQTKQRGRQKRKDKEDSQHGTSPSTEGVAGGVLTGITSNKAALICAMFGFLLYINAIWICGFCYDDRVAIVENPDVLNQHDGPETSLIQVFQHDFWGTHIRDETSHKSYRPLVILSLRFDAWVSRALGVAEKEAWVFHLSNALFYAITCWLVVKYILSAVVAPQQQQAGITTLLAGMWFAAHPTHSESVAGNVGRADLLAAIFCMVGTKFHSTRRTVACVMSFFAACLCKETSVLVPVVLAVTDITKALFSMFTKTKSSTNTSSAPSLIAVSFGYVLFRSWLFGDSAQTLHAAVTLVDNFVPHLHFSAKIRTAIWIQVKYFLLLVWPSKLSCDYSLGVIDPVRSWFSLEMLLGAGLLCLIGLWTKYAFARLYQSGDVSLLLALGWTLGPLVPASHIIVGIGTVMAERLLFLPSIGAAMLLCHVLGSTGSRSFVTRVALVLCIVLFSFKTISRNPDWQNNHVLFKADLETYPRSLRMLIANIRDVYPTSAYDVERYTKTAQAIVEENADLFSAEAIKDLNASIILAAADRKINSTDASVAADYADDLIEQLDDSDALLKVKAYTKKGRAFLKAGVDNHDSAAFLDAAEAFNLATQFGNPNNDKLWFVINEGKGRSFYEAWRDTRDPFMIAEAAAAFEIVISLGDLFGGNDERWSDVQYSAGKAFFARGAATNNLDSFQAAAAAYKGAIELGNVSGDARWAELHKALGQTLQHIGPATRDLNAVKESALVLRTAIEFGDDKTQVYEFCLFGNALAMADAKIEAYNQFQECFRREKEKVVISTLGAAERRDRVSYRINYAILMEKLSGVRSMDFKAVATWGLAALEAIDYLLNMSKEETAAANLLPAEQLQLWNTVKVALNEQMGRVQTQIDENVMNMAKEGLQTELHDTKKIAKEGLQTELDGNELKIVKQGPQTECDENELNTTKEG